MALLPLAVASCGSDPEPIFEPLSYSYLPPIPLNVTSISIEPRFIPAGVEPDVTAQDPVSPLGALRAMADDRLRALGTGNSAVFAILDASMIRTDDTVSGSMAVSLTIRDDNNAQLGFAEARVKSKHTGGANGLRRVLYEMTKAMMTEMNVEFEYQVRHNLKDYLAQPEAPDTPVEQMPLDQPPGQ
jgi:hypothetical protein